MRQRVRSERGLALIIVAIVLGAIVLSDGDQLGSSAAVTTPRATTPTTVPTGGSTTTTTTAGSSAGSSAGSGAATTTTTAAAGAFSAANRAQVQLGSKGSDVTALQQRLTALGYNAGTADGVFGPTTATAVKAFQQAKGLTADGIVGSATWTALAAGK